MQNKSNTYNQINPSIITSELDYFAQKEKDPSSPV